MAEALTKAGRYQIVGELGRGSMGVVYQGFDPIIGRTVAIKTMLPEGLSAEEFQEYKARFQREAMAAGILAHPNIITIYDFGEDNGLLYLAMEYLEGKTLERIVQEQGVLTIETILPIYDQVCSALDHAHRNKIVHRDVKPANIMIVQNGLVKVTDFGIAKLMAMGMTQVGQILGTPNYMSPEQVKGRQIDGRSDIFSLGVILYELVTGEKPFGGQNITTVIYKIMNENPIPPRDLDASISAGLSYVISKALAKSVDERYQTCRELADDLKNYKSLGGASSGQGTVILTAAPVLEKPVTPAPPAAAPQPVAPPPVAQKPPLPPPPAKVQTPPAPPRPPVGGIGEAPIGTSRDADVVPPSPAPQQPIPQIAWVLGAFMVVAIMGVVAYFLVLRPRGHREGPQRVEHVASSQNPQASVGAATLPGAALTAASAPAAVPPPAIKPAVAALPGASKPAEAPAKEQEPRARPAAEKLGQLAVSANVNGAHISVDGRSDPSWVTPYTIADVSAGAHNVVVSMDGYDDFRQSVTIEGGQTGSVAATLSAPRAELDIITDPAGLEVLIDGKPYGSSPVRATLALGKHTYTVKSPGQAPYENSVTLSDGDIITNKVTLHGGVPTGIVEVHTSPPGATVQADGSPVGGQTPTSFRLSVGSHSLVISMAGHKPVQQQITVPENGTIPVSVTLAGQ